jgi:hypothetical protein
VPIYDATGLDDLKLEDHLDNLAKSLPLFKDGEEEVPEKSVVTVGYTARLAKTSGEVWLLTFYVQWVIVLAYPGMPGDAQGTKKKAKGKKPTGVPPGDSVPGGKKVKLSKSGVKEGVVVKKKMAAKE